MEKKQERAQIQRKISMEEINSIISVIRMLAKILQLKDINHKNTENLKVKGWENVTVCVVHINKIFWQLYLNKVGEINETFKKISDKY